MKTRFFFSLTVATIFFSACGMAATPVVLEQKEIREENLLATYPVYSNVPDEVNVKIKQLVDDQLAAFKKDLADMSPSSTAGNKSFIEIHQSTPGSVTSELLSLRFVTTTYFAGAAHPNSFTAVFNYDLGAKKELKLEDVFKGEYLAVLSGNAKAKLIEKFQKEGLGEVSQEGVAPKPENFQNFLINSDSFTFIFNPYQVGPYAIGSQEISIKFSSIRSILNTDLEFVRG